MRPAEQSCITELKEFDPSPEPRLDQEGFVLEFRSFDADGCPCEPERPDARILFVIPCCDRNGCYYQFLTDGERTTTPDRDVGPICYLFRAFPAWLGWPLPPRYLHPTIGDRAWMRQEIEKYVRATGL